MTSGIQKSLNAILDRRPIIVAVAGPNGAGKSTFYNTHLRGGGLPFVNADVIAAGLNLDAYAAADAADVIRRTLVDQGASFVFETVFSDPAGEKLRFLQLAASRGYTVVLIFIGISSPELSDVRVSMRVMKGGHDVPKDKLVQRFPRTLENLKSALSLLDHVYVIDNSNLAKQFQMVAHFEKQRVVEVRTPLPLWFRNLVTNEDLRNL
jgi:predicted ABC-type ATPase